MRPALASEVRPSRSGWTDEFVSDCPNRTGQAGATDPFRTAVIVKAAPYGPPAAGHYPHRRTHDDRARAPRPPTVKRHGGRFARYLRGVVGDAAGVGNRAAITVVVPLLVVLAAGSPGLGTVRILRGVHVAVRPQPGPHQPVRHAAERGTVPSGLHAHRDRRQPVSGQGRVDGAGTDGGQVGDHLVGAGIRPKKSHGDPAERDGPAT